MTILRSLALVAALAVTGSGAANAASCTIEGVVTYTLTQGEPGLATSDGCFLGNDTGGSGKGNGDKRNDNAHKRLSGTKVFVLDGFVLGGKTDGDGDGNATIKLDGQSWSVGGNIFQDMRVVLKQGPTYAIFKIDTNMFSALEDNRFSGTWTTAGPGKSVNDISHASIWYTGSKVVPPIDVPAVVPLPAGGALLLSALAGFAFLRRRKTT